MGSVSQDAGQCRAVIHGILSVTSPLPKSFDDFSTAAVETS